MDTANKTNSPKRNASIAKMVSVTITFFPIDKVERKFYTNGVMMAGKWEPYLPNRLV